MLSVEVEGLEPSSYSFQVLRTTRLGQHFLMFRNSRFVLHHRKPDNQCTIRFLVSIVYPTFARTSVPGLYVRRPD